MATERLSNLGYMALGKESAIGTAVVPSIFVPLYKESMATDIMLDEENPIVGQPYKKFNVFQGQREHKGSVTVMGEPNTMAHLFNMLMYKSGTSGSGTYTHTFTATTANDAATYTVDLAKGLHVFRYLGVRAADIKPSFNKNKMEVDLALSALTSFTVREVASVTNTGSPWTITLKTNYDANATLGLVTGDVMQWYKVSDGTYTNFTVASVAGVTTLTTTTDVHSMTAGDIISLRPQTVSLSLLSPFLWSSTQFCFSDTAANAINATQTQVEQGSMWEIMHEVNAAGGEHRSGSIDPATIARLQYDTALKIKYFFDTPDELNRYLTLSSAATRALVIRHYSGSYELRLTFNQIIAKAGGIPALETGKLIYQDVDYSPIYKSADSQAFDVKVINTLSSI